MSISDQITDHPAYDSFPITPNDNADLEVPVRAIRANVAGTVVVDTPRSRELDGGTPGTNKRTLNFTAGETRPLRALKVYAASTATGLEGMP